MTRVWVLSPFLSLAIACLPPLGEDTSPQIVIASPSDGFVNSSSAEVEVEITNLDISGEALGGAHVEGEGHWHLYVSNDTVGDRALWGMASETFMLATRLEVGENEICAELTQNDHSPLDPAAEACELIEVPVEARRIEVLSPRHEESIWKPIDIGADDALEIEIGVDNFTMDIDQAGGPSDPGQGAGHWHLYVGPSSYVNPLSSVHVLASDETTIELQEVLDIYQEALESTGGSSDMLADEGGLVPGTYTITAELMNHDHSPLVPPVLDFFRINVVD